MAFKKGQSGNPSGRPPRSDEERRVVLLARKHTDRAIAKLSELIDDKDGRIAAIASSALLDRAWGKPAQFVEKHVTHERRVTYAERIQTPAAAPEAPPRDPVGHTVQ